MTGLKVALWIAAIGCLTAVPFIFSPWPAIESISAYFGVDPLPSTPITVYFFKVAFGVFGLIGVFFIILAVNPLKYGAMLYLGAFGLIFFGILALILGTSFDLPPAVFLGDGLSGLILGIAVLFFSLKAK